MSFTDPAEAAQPEGEGQGAEAQGGSPWESYLTRFPEEQRDIAAEAFREMEGHATKRFQAESEYRKSWEPYEQLGVNQLSPDEVQWALQFRQAAVENPTAIKEWWDSYAQQHNLNEPAAPEPGAGEFDFQDPAQQQLEQLLKAQLGPIQQKLEQYDQRWQAQEQEQITRRGEQIVESQFAELKKQHPDAFADDGPHGARKVVEALALNYVDSDPDHAIPRAFSDYQTLRAQLEKSLLEGKANAPAAAESGGVPDVSVSAPKTLAEAGAMVAEQLRQQNRS